MKPTRPLLRYFGGKWQLRHWIIEHFPPHRFYAEPFAGAASVLLGKEPCKDGEIINDLNGDVINLFRVMQSKDQAEDLMGRLEWTPYAQSELALSSKPTDDPIEKARRMVVRSFFGIEVAGMETRGTGFRMGNVDLRREDQEGKRTFRNCARDWANWKDALPLIRERLKHVMIYQRDALEFIDLMDSGQCLLYVDPPYHPFTRSESRYAVDFTADQHAALVERLLRCQSMVVLSGYDCAEYIDLHRAGWEKAEKDSRANMSLRRRKECLWINPAAQRGGFFSQVAPVSPRLLSALRSLLEPEPTPAPARATAAEGEGRA
jgi:DNA adenine methylase